LQLHDRTSASVHVPLDEVCARVLSRALPLRFGEIVTPADLEAAFRLRFQAIVERGWGLPSDFPEGTERDRDDDRARQLGGWDGGRLIATARLVFPAPGELLPTERAFELGIEPEGEVLDFGRLVVAKTHRGTSLRVLSAMLAQAWIVARSHGFSRFCAADSAAMIRLYRRMGFEIEQLGPGRRYWREERYPVRFDLEASAPALAERWS
jgi:GNAT superfamily N-acetyltransferase